MEIKKYVLLNDYNLILDSKNEEELRVIHYKDGDVLKVVVDNWYYPLEKLDYKTSDNILDLVEVGDLVMSDDYVGALKVLSNTKHYFRTYHAIVARKNVKAIYKRQSNGDYKRYDVSEKIWAMKSSNCMSKA